MVIGAPTSQFHKVMSTGAPTSQCHKRTILSRLKRNRMPYNVLISDTSFIFIFFFVNCPDPVTQPFTYRNKYCEDCLPGPSQLIFIYYKKYFRELMSRSCKEYTSFTEKIWEKSPSFKIFHHFIHLPFSHFSK